MGGDAVNAQDRIDLRMPSNLMAELTAHLFPGDGDEHAAVLAASVHHTQRGTRLLGHRLYFPKEGTEYVLGHRGHQMLTATFVMECVLDCAALGMAYLAIHAHGGSDRVAFSTIDLQSHERGYPALRDILDGRPAGGLVFATKAVAGDIWLPDGSRAPVHSAISCGLPVQQLYPAPPTTPIDSDPAYDRQARLLGDRGQALLATQKIGVIGAGGVGSLVVEQLSRLGVGELVLIDPDRIETSNLSRVVGSRRRDSRPLLTHPRLGRVAAHAERLRTSKVNIARRVAKQADGNTRITTHQGNVTEHAIAQTLTDCDFMFLAADSMQARHLFNALVHQYVIPGLQMGVKAQLSKATGDILDLFGVCRPILPGQGCLWCNGLIDSAKLQEEATNPEQLRRQRYVDDENVIAPSVITLNGVVASLATTHYLMSLTGIMPEQDLLWLRHDPRTNELITELPRRDQDCRQCSSTGRLGRGATWDLPTTLPGT